VIGLSPAVRIFFARQPADMRRSFDGLLELVRVVVGQDPLSGHLFVFRNKTGDPLKLLYWDRTGLCIFYKRLEKGTFRFPDAKDGGSVELTSGDLLLILEGIDLASARRLPRYRRNEDISTSVDVKRSP
jgi:transposase